MYVYLWLKNWFDDLVGEEGQDLIEYAMILALVVLVAIIGMAALGTKISGLWTSISDKLVVPT
jgi:Flp pilus assembly pilin Flp